MTIIALPDRNILVPHLEFPAWLKHPRERVSNMLAPLGGMLTPLGVSGAVQTPWYLTNGVTPIAAYQPKSAASLAASYVNLANPGTYDCTVGNAPSLVAGGWSFNGSSNYLKTGITNAGNAWSAFIQYTGAGTSSAGGYYAFGVLDGGTTKFFGMSPTYFGTGWLSANGGFDQIAGGAHTSGNAGIAGNRGYYNGSAVGSTISQSGSVPSYEIAIGTLNNNGTYTNNLLALTVVAFIVYNATLTAPQITTLVTAMAAV